jgi:hypothetical protein
MTAYDHRDDGLIRAIKEHNIKYVGIDTFDNLKGLCGIDPKAGEVYSQVRDVEGWLALKFGEEQLMLPRLTTATDRRGIPALLHAGDYVCVTGKQ